MRVTFTPLSSTVGAQAFSKRASGSVAGVQLALNEAGRPLMMMGPCGFPAELTWCFQGMQPNKTVTVTVRDNLPSSDGFGVYLEWQP
jgi:hypothetical protein